MNNNILVFTDGSSLIRKGHYESSSAGSIYINHNHICEFGSYNYDSTNSFGELYAIVMAFDKLSDIIYNNPELNKYQIFIISDSEYVVKSLNIYLKSWIKQGMNNNWINSKNKPVAYQSIFKYIYRNYFNITYNVNGIKVNIVHINSHIKNVDKSYNKFNLNITKEEFIKISKYNDYVDKLANYIRNKKEIYYERSYVKWLKTKKINMVNGKIIISPRKKRER